MSTLQTRTVPSRPEAATSRRPSGVNAMPACSSVSGPGNVRTSPRPAGETSQTRASPGSAQRGEPRSRAVERDAPDRLRVAAERQGLAELSARHVPGLREPVHASGGDAPPVAAELDVEDRSSVSANDVELLPGRQPVQLELAAFRVTGDEQRAVGADVEVDDPGGTARIRDHGDLLSGREVEHLRHDGRGSASPLPRRDRDAVAADERDPLAPGDARFGAVVDAGERPELSAGADVPDTHRAIGAERREPRAVRAEPGREDAAAMRAEM